MNYKLLLKSKEFIFFLMIIVLHIFIIKSLIFQPYPEIFVNPYLRDHGLKPYKQIMDQHSPGLMFFPFNFNSLGMTTPEIARIWLIGIVLITQLMLFITSIKVLKSYKKALLVSFIYLIWQPFFEGTTFWIDNILPVFLLPGFYITYELIIGKKRNFKAAFLSGFLFGLAIIFKQVALPLTALVAFYLFWKKRDFKLILYFLLGLILPISLMIFYFWRIGVIKDFWYWTIIFNLTVFAKYGKKAAPYLGHYTRVLFVFLFSTLSFFSKAHDLKILLFIFIIGSLAGAIARFDFVHFQPSLPFVALASVLGFESVYKNKYLKWVVLIYIFVTLWWITIFYKGHISSKVILYDEQTINISKKIKQLVKNQEKIFILGGPLHLYQMTQTLPAGDLFYIQAPWYFMVAEDQTLEGIKKDRPKIVVMDRNLIFEGNKIIDYASKIDQYLMTNYYQIDQVGSVQIMQRKNAP